MFDDLSEGAGDVGGVGGVAGCPVVDFLGISSEEGFCDEGDWGFFEGFDLSIEDGDAEDAVVGEVLGECEFAVEFGLSIGVEGVWGCVDGVGGGAAVEDVVGGDVDHPCADFGGCLCDVSGGVYVEGYGLGGVVFADVGLADGGGVDDAVGFDFFDAGLGMVFVEQVEFDEVFTRAGECGADGFEGAVGFELADYCSAQ